LRKKLFLNSMLNCQIGSWLNKLINVYINYVDGSKSLQIKRSWIRKRDSNINIKSSILLNNKFSFFQWISVLNFMERKHFWRVRRMIEERLITNMSYLFYIIYGNSVHGSRLCIKNRRAVPLLRAALKSGAVAQERSPIHNNKS